MVSWFWGDVTCCWRYLWMGINEFGMTFPWIWCDFFMLREVSRDSLRTLWELCGNSAGTLWDLSGNSPGTPKAKSPWFAQGFQDFWQGAWARSVMEKWSRSNENDAPKSGKASKMLSQNVEFNRKVTPEVTILDKFGQLCGDVWVIFHPVVGDFAWKSMNSGWLFMTLRWLFRAPWTPRELYGNSPKAPKAKNPWFAQGF